GGAAIDFAARAPELAAQAGLELEHFAPRARIGAVGSGEWRWLEGFFRSYLPRLVERGLMTAAELAAWTREWEARSAARASFVVAPTMCDVILRKPVAAQRH